MNKRVTAALALILILLLTLGGTAETKFQKRISAGDGFFFGRLEGRWRLYTEEGELFLDYFWENDELKDSGHLPFTGFGEEQAAPIRFGARSTAMIGAVDRSGELVVPAFRGELEAFSGGVARYRVEDAFWGLVDDRGRVLLDSRESGLTSLKRLEEDVWRGETAEKETAWYLLKDGVLEAPAVVSYALTDAEAKADNALPLQAFPALDGAGELQGLIRALLSGAGSEDAEAFTCGGTAKAFEGLTKGDLDIILTLRAPIEYLLAAAGTGIEFGQTEFALDGLVFFTGEDNPADGLTMWELVDILSGKADAWPDGTPVILYHQAEGTEARALAGSIMGDEALAKSSSPLATEGAFWSFPGALGYCLRSQLRELPAGVKRLKLDGAAADDLSMLEGAYPLTWPVIAVWRGDEQAPAAAALCGYLMGDAGRAVVQACGFVPLAGNAEEVAAVARDTLEDRYDPVDYEHLKALAGVWVGVPVRFEGRAGSVVTQDGTDYLVVDLGASAQMSLALAENRAGLTLPEPGARCRVYGTTLGNVIWQDTERPLVALEYLETIEGQK